MSSKISPARQRVIDAVKAHARDHYEAGGWDILVETMDDNDIFELTRQCRTANGAIKAMAKELGIADAYRADIVAAGGGEDRVDEETTSERVERLMQDPAFRAQLEAEAAWEHELEARYS